MTRFGRAMAALMAPAVLVLGCPFSGGLIEGTGGAATGGGGGCKSDGDCDDKNVCTKDTCANGSCAHAADDTAKPTDGTECKSAACEDGNAVYTVHAGAKCGAGLMLVCDPTGLCVGCAADADCGMPDDCRTSKCRADMSCEYTHAEAGTKVSAQVVGDCRDIVCDGAGNAIAQDNDADVPDDMADCTEGACAMGVKSQKPSAVGTPCADGKSYCNAAGACVPCTTNAGCDTAAGEKCYEESACVSCSNTMQDGDETDVNCGGSCPKCADKENCKSDGDCLSDRCVGEICISCNDGLKNGTETGVDCGGSCPKKCKGEGCADVVDCVTGHCIDGVCCDTPCDVPCRACNVDSMVGTCVNLGAGHDDFVCDKTLFTFTCPCAVVFTCNGLGACVVDGGKLHHGEPCSKNVECFSNLCDGDPKTCR